MNPDRWRQIQQIFHSVLQCEPERREAFLLEACAGDDDLRKEVASLLSINAKSEDPFDVPALQILANALAEGQEFIKRPNLAGCTLSHYRVLEKIGEGGMGVVYRAQDSRLMRTVAIKLLSTDRVADPERKRRFVKEAKAASALNHPNIVTIHDIDHADGLDFIVMEYLAGRTLDRHLPRKGMPLHNVLDLGIQIADALAAAHSAGIVHRDLKPSNVMVSEHGQVKILDFGLAKLVEKTLPNPGGVRTADFLESTTSTEEGVVVGTVAYMSPEQAEGKKVDARSDIFSFGALIYEMACGQRPFQGGSAASILAEIIRGEPKQFGEIAPHLPVEFEKVVRRCLRKEPERRFQSISDVRVELQEVKEQLASQPGTDQSEQPQAKKRGWLYTRLIPGVLFVLIILAVAVGWWMLRPPDGLPESSPIQVTKTEGWEGQPALSPDGGRIAYTSNETGNLEIFVTGSSGGTPQNLTQHPAQDQSPAWFPDGSAILFASDRNGETGIWKMSQLGKDAMLLIPDADQPAVSPDGRQVAFTVAGRQGYSRIGVASLENPGKPRILTDDDDGPFGHSDPVWSPDGKSICYSTWHNLWSIPVAGGAARPLTGDGEYDADPYWSFSGRFIYFTSYRGGTTALWRQSVTRGAAQRLTLGTGTECHPSLSRDGVRLAYSTGGPQTRLVLRTRSSGNETELSRVAGDQMAAIAPDNRTIAIVSRRWAPDLRLGLQPLQQEGEPAPVHLLTDQPGWPSQPRFSHDGKWIAYYQVQGTERHVWIAGTSGDSPVQITSGPTSEGHPAWSPDDSQLAFTSQSDGGLSIRTISVRDGRPGGSARLVETTDVEAAYAPDWSPDGRSIAFIGIRDSSPDAWVVSLDRSFPTRRITKRAGVSRVRWDPATGGWLVAGVWGESQCSIKGVKSPGALPADLVPPVILGSAEAPGFFDVSYDAKLLIFVRQAMRGDVWVMEAKKGLF